MSCCSRRPAWPSPSTSPRRRRFLRDFYGVERNATAAYRWSKPSASIGIPAVAPTDYRVVLGLQDTPLASPRPVTVYINGEAVGTVVPGGTPHDYVFSYEYAVERWAKDRRPALEIEVATPPFTAPGDTRALGIIVTRVVVEPVGPRVPLQLWLLPAYLGTLLLAYAALRAMAFPRTIAVGLLGLVVVTYASLAVVARPTALALAYQPFFEPLWIVGAALFALPLAAVGRAWARAGVASPLPTTADEAVFWSRRSLPLVPVVALACGLRAYHLTHLSLWLDEVFTILFTRLPGRPCSACTVGTISSHPSTSRP
jgi:hypothetical protein